MSLVFPLHLFFPVFKKYIYLFGCTGSYLLLMGSLIFVVACGIQFPDQGLNPEPLGNAES